jgi:hypothetical protein
MDNTDPKKIDKFLEGVQVFLELCGKHPNLTEEFIEKLKKAERGEPTTTDIEKFIEKEAQRRYEQLKKEEKIVKM